LLGPLTGCRSTGSNHRPTAATSTYSSRVSPPTCN